MKPLIFIQTNDGEVRYKCDTFWSTSTKINYAKVYSSFDDKQIDGWITTYDYNIREYIKKNPDDNSIIENYKDAKMGYRFVNNELLKDGGFSIKDDVIDSDLRPLVYTHQMIIDSDVRVIDIRKQIIREEKLNELL